eukprot:TRINITY_DN8134_c0_g1_i2.p1 TRINITY_DN8134_c0_g1~~TRINITY_DN8134_c0_g1_i2.p1  ORF type:complete len:849 (+),score=199.88 TRINITY_DN8134_c0_g1_i2:51-2549(+)
MVELHFGFAESHLDTAFAIMLQSHNDACRVLLDQLVYVYVRLRQLDVILKAIATAAQQADGAQLELQHVTASLAAAVPGLPVGQALELALPMLTNTTATDAEVRVALCLIQHGLVSINTLGQIERVVNALQVFSLRNDVGDACTHVARLLLALKARLSEHGADPQQIDGQHGSMDQQEDGNKDESALALTACEGDDLSASLMVLQQWHLQQGPALAKALKTILSDAYRQQPQIAEFFASDLYLDALPLHAPATELLLRYCKSKLKPVLSKQITQTVFKLTGDALKDSTFKVDWQSTLPWPFADDDAIVRLIADTQWQFMDMEVACRVLPVLLILQTLTPPTGFAKVLARTSTSVFSAILKRGDGDLRRLWLHLMRHQCQISAALAAAIDHRQMGIFAQRVGMWIAMFRSEFESVQDILLAPLQAMEASGDNITLLSCIAQALDEIDSKGSRTKHAVTSMLEQLVQLCPTPAQDTTSDDMFAFLGLSIKHKVDLPQPWTEAVIMTALNRLADQASAPCLMFLTHAAGLLTPAQLQHAIVNVSYLSNDESMDTAAAELIKVLVKHLDEASLMTLLQDVELHVQSEAKRSTILNALQTWMALNKHASTASQLRITRQYSSNITELLISRPVSHATFEATAQALASTLTIGLSQIPYYQADAVLVILTNMVNFACQSRDPDALLMYHRACHEVLQTLLSRQRPSVDGATAVVVVLVARQLHMCLRFLNLTNCERAVDNVAIVDETTRLMQLFSNSKANCSKHAPELIGACITQLAAGNSLTSSIRADLCRGVFAVMDMIEERERNFIHSTLPSYTRGIAKQLFSEFESKHKFKGRI